MKLKNLLAENKMNLLAENEMNLKLKTDMNQNMKPDENLKLMAKIKPQDEAGNVATIPYFRYVASHWEGVAAANPRLDGGHWPGTEEAVEELVGQGGGQDQEEGVPGGGQEAKREAQ